MANILRAPDGHLRNGWWVGIFYLPLASLVVPASTYAQGRGMSVGVGTQALLAMLATCMCVALRGERLTSVLGDARSWGREVPRGLVAATAIWGSAAGVAWLVGGVEWEPAHAPVWALLEGASVCAAVAVVEELVFRGFAFQRLVGALGACATQLLMGGYFVLTHSEAIGEAGELSVLAALNIFLASLLFGGAYLKTRSLALPISLHFALNFVQGPVLGFGVSGTRSESLWRPHLTEGMHWWHGASFGLEASIPGTVAVAIAFAVLAAARSSKVLSNGAATSGESAT